jgi:hypothetical protein
MSLQDCILEKIKVSLHLVHHTENGPIHLEATGAWEGRWLARYWGKQLDGSRDFASFDQAESWLLRCFAELFPDHRCGRRCIPSPAPATKGGGRNPFSRLTNSSSRDFRIPGATHKHPKVQKWLARHPRFHMYFTPTSSSWLNMVERFFRDLTGTEAPTRDLPRCRGIDHGHRRLHRQTQRPAQELRVDRSSDVCSSDLARPHRAG